MDYDPKRLALRHSEDLYDVATRYGFARRYVRGRSVLDVHWGEIGYGPLVLCETAWSVEALSNSPEAAALASKAYPAPNVSYLGASLPGLPHPDGSFEVVLAFGVLEKLDRPEELVREARRILKPGGLFVAATPDRQANSNERNRRDPENRGEMYVGELEEMLQKHFGSAHLYRQGSVAGGAVFRAPGPGLVASLESASPALSEPDFGTGPPATRFVLAVCGDAGSIGTEEAYMLIDRDRGVFEECQDHAEDARLLRAEALRMQETEVQTFQDALKLQRSEIAYLKALLDRSESQVRNWTARHQDLRDRHENLKAHYETRKNNQDKLHERFRVFKERYERLEARNETLEARIRDTETENRDTEIQNRILRKQKQALEAEGEALRDRLGNIEAQRDALQKRLREIESSGTWRFFGPYRRLRIRLLGHKDTR